MSAQNRYSTNDPPENRPHRGLNPTVGRRTGTVIYEVQRAEDGRFESFDDLISQADFYTPPKVTARKRTQNSVDQKNEEGPRSHDFTRRHVQLNRGELVSRMNEPNGHRQLHSRAKSASGILLHSSSLSSSSATAATGNTVHRVRHLNQSQAVVRNDCSAIAQSNSLPAFLERNRVKMTSGNKYAQETEFGGSSKMDAPSTLKSLKDTTRANANHRSRTWTERIHDAFWSNVNKADLGSSRLRWLKYPALLYCAFSLYFMTSALYGTVVETVEGELNLPSRVQTEETGSATSSYLNELSIFDLLHRVVKLQPPALAVTANAFTYAVDSTSDSIGTADDQKEQTAFNLPTACVWTTYTESMFDDLVRWQVSWNGPMSLLVVTTALPGSPAHTSLFLRLDSLLSTRNNTNDSLKKDFFSAKWSSRWLSLFQPQVEQPGHSKSNFFSLNVHILHVKSVEANSPNVYVNTARLFAAPTQVGVGGDVVLFPGGLEGSPPASSQRLASLDADELSPMGTRTSPQLGETDLTILVSQRATTSSFEMNPALTSPEHPLNTTAHHVPLPLASHDISPKLFLQSRPDLSPIIIPQEYPVWCVERSALVFSRAWAWDDCLFDFILRSGGEYALRTMESSSDAGHDAGPIRVLAWQEKFLRRMKGEFRREMCDLAVKQAQAMNQVRKMGWVDEFCNEYAGYGPV